MAASSTSLLLRKGIAINTGGGVPVGYFALKYQDAVGNYRTLLYQTATGAHLPLAYLKAA